MGLLVDGEWKDQWYDTKKSGGRFVRPQTQFRNAVSADPAAQHPAAAGRYHLYVGLACPWAHRTLIFRKLKGLEDKISVSVVASFMGDEGWIFDPSEPGASEDHLFGLDRLYKVYLKAKADYSGRVTVPVLWDKQAGTIVSNESAEIIRMLNSAFDGLDGVDSTLDFYPEPLRAEIDAINDRVYHSVNNGVYKSGFATSQEAYEEAVTALFDCLDWLDDLLAQKRYLTGSTVTEADWRLFTTLVRFDPVYVGHFKCNIRRIADYPHLSGYLRELYQWPGIAPTCDFRHIKEHYYRSHESINPTRIVPVGPVFDLTAPHGREGLKAA